MINATRSRLQAPLSALRTKPWNKVARYGLYGVGGGFLTKWLAYELFRAESHSVHGLSMSPALSPAYHETGDCDIVLASPWTWHWPSMLVNDGASSTTSILWPFRPWYADMRRGDVVVVRKPHAPEETTIKRIVALPGDRVIRCRKRLEVNKSKARKLGFDAQPRETVVPLGHIWIEGDNWRDTFDSNDFGPVPINLVVGRASHIVWPWARWGRISERPAKFAGKTRVVESVASVDDDQDNWEKLLEVR